MPHTPSEPEPYNAARNARARRARGLLVVVAVLCMLLIGAGTAFYVFWPEQNAATRSVDLTQELERFVDDLVRKTPGVRPTPAPVEEARRDLGRFQGFMGDDMDSRQARDLLALVEAQPGKDRYTIAYTIGRTRYEVSLDLREDAIIRIETTGEHGRSEYWLGEAMARVRAASEGGDFNDAPDGPSPPRVYEF